MHNKPVLEYLNQEGIELIHETAIKILNKYGVKVEDKEVQSLFKEHGCEVIDDRVKISAELIEKMINNKKDVVKLYALDGKELVIEPGKLVTHAPGGIPFIVDRESGKIRDAVTKDFIEAVYVMNQVNQLDVPCALVTPSDIPNQISQLRQCELMFKYCSKPIYSPGISSATEVDYIVEMFELCSDGNLAERPRGMVGVSPESPLYIPKEISYILKRVIKAGIPTTILAAPLPGMSSPYTIAGSMAQLHAEMMAMGVLAYLYNPKTPVMYGSRITFSNMRSGNATWGIPETGICGGIAAQLARRIGMIADVYGTATSSCTFDSQSGFEQGVNGTIPSLTGGEFISGFGTMASNMLTSLEQLVIDNEYYAMLRNVVKGVTIGEDELGLDVLSDVLDGSEFIMEMHTVEHLRSGEIFDPEIGFKGMFDEWENGGRKTIADVAREKLVDMLDTEIEEVIDPERSKAIDKIIERASKELL